MSSDYCPSRHRTVRRLTRVVNVGGVGVGGNNPIRVQSMTTSDTEDVAATVAQAIRLAEAGSEIIRITAPNKAAAAALKEIRRQFRAAGFSQPLVADIHFLPSAAMEAVEHVEKVRVNPGNYADKKKFAVLEYTDAAYAEELERLHAAFTPLVLRAKELGRSLRIGTNHGSLSDRIMNRFGDSPNGMVESALEFIRIAESHGFKDMVLSMKSSNPKVMVEAYRLAAARMTELGMDYPLHLGVTEAGEGEDGRMKSSIGIGALLLDGLGDTIRVSLTEASHLEMEPCTRLRDLGTKAATEKFGVEKFEEKGRDFKDFARRESELPTQKEDDAIDLRNILHRDGSVLSAVTPAMLATEDPFYRDLGAKLAVGMPLRDIATSDSILLTEIPAADDEKAMRSIRRLQEIGVGIVADAAALAATRRRAATTGATSPSEMAFCCIFAQPPAVCNPRRDLR